MGKISTIKAFGGSEAWMVFEDGAPIGEVVHQGFRRWAAVAMDDTSYPAPSKREVIMRLRLLNRGN